MAGVDIPPPPADPSNMGNMAEIYQQATGAPVSTAAGGPSVDGKGPPNQQDTIEGALTTDEAIELFEQSTGMSVKSKGVDNIPGSVNQGNTALVQKYRDGLIKEHDTSPEKPMLPHSNAPAPETAGNQWLNTAAMNAFYSIMKDRAREQMFMQLLGAQNSIKAQVSIKETGDDKAASQLTEGMETFVKEIVAGVLAAVGAVATGIGLGQSIKAQKENIEFNRGVEKDSSFGVKDPDQKATVQRNNAEIKTIQQRAESNQASHRASDVDGHAIDQTTGLNKQDRKRLEKLQTQNAEITRARDETQRVDHQQRNTMIQTQTQLVQQLTQAATSLSNAVFDLLISFERARQTMDDTTNQLNQSFLDSQQKSMQQAVDDFNAAIQNMVDTSKQLAQSIRFSV